jgi:chromodomain-helicase-DNA-binding protein 1
LIAFYSHIAQLALIVEEENVRQVAESGSQSIDLASSQDQAGSGVLNRSLSYATNSLERQQSERAERGRDDDVLFCIKWLDKSHMHNSWHTEEELNSMDIKGLKKLKNYLQNVKEVTAWKASASAEDVDFFNCRLEQMRELTVTYTTVERVIGSREQSEEGTQYYCKWEGLPYSASTWENASLISARFQHKIDDYLRRNSSTTASAHSSSIPKHRLFRTIKSPPEFLPEHLTLRDYQLDGLNWLAHSWCRANSVILADEMGLQGHIFSSLLNSCRSGQDYPDDLFHEVSPQPRPLWSLSSCCSSFHAHGMATRVCFMGARYGHRGVPR